MHILVINSGSSSIKYHIYEMQRKQLLFTDKVERIGELDSISVYRKQLIPKVTECLSINPFNMF